jgi:hypothetical protein
MWDGIILAWVGFSGNDPFGSAQVGYFISMFVAFAPSK